MGMRQEVTELYRSQYLIKSKGADLSVRNALHPLFLRDTPGGRCCVPVARALHRPKQSEDPPCLHGRASDGQRSSSGNAAR